jgi:hypothetical protein
MVWWTALLLMLALCWHSQDTLQYLAMPKFVHVNSGNDAPCHIWPCPINMAEPDRSICTCKYELELCHAWVCTCELGQWHSVPYLALPQFAHVNSGNEWWLSLPLINLAMHARACTWKLRQDNFLSLSTIQFGYAQACTCKLGQDTFCLSPPYIFCNARVCTCEHGQWLFLPYLAMPQFAHANSGNMMSLSAISFAMPKYAHVNLGKTSINYSLSLSTIKFGCARACTWELRQDVFSLSLSLSLSTLFLLCLSLHKRRCKRLMMCVWYFTFSGSQ